MPLLRMSYDRALTVFSPDGHLFQVDYAIKALEKGSAIVGIVGKNALIVGVERRELEFLQRRETVHKVSLLCEGIWVSFSGLAADARSLITRAQIECQRHWLKYSEKASIQKAAKYIADIQQSFTLRGGVRPFGVGVMVFGLEEDGRPRLFFSEPSGVSLEWKANALGNGSKEIRKLLEKTYLEGMSTEEGTMLVVSSLLETVQASKENITVLVIDKEGKKEVSSEQLEVYIIENESRKESELRNAISLEQ